MSAALKRAQAFHNAVHSMTEGYAVALAEMAAENEQLRKTIALKDDQLKIFARHEDESRQERERLNAENDTQAKQLDRATAAAKGITNAALALLEVCPNVRRTTPFELTQAVADDLLVKADSLREELHKW